jgi:hypothetical protein
MSLSSQQGTTLLKFRKNINDIRKSKRVKETESSGIEGFENKELWTKDKVYSDSVDQVIQNDMDELKTLEEEFMKLLSEYSANYKLYMTDVMNVVESESSNYIGKNIKTNDGVISYINNLGIARSYDSNTFSKRHESCGSGEPIKVNADNITALKFRKGDAMRENEPCGYSGQNIVVESEDSQIINLATQTGAVASQSTSYENGAYPAINAIDGNMNTFNHTENVKGTWWQVRLPESSFIRNVVIYNRKDCCWDRFTTVRLDVLNDEGNSIYNKIIQRATNNQLVFKVDNINKVGRYVRITQETPGNDNFLHMAEVQVWGTDKIDVAHGSVGYVDGNGLLHQYSDGVVDTSDPSCPTDKVGVDNDVWKLFKKGSNMTKTSVCDMGNLDVKLKSHVQQLNKQLMDLTQKINSKINETKNKVSQIKSQNNTEAQYLNEQLGRFKDLYKKYNNLDKKGYASLDAMMEDMQLVSSSNLYKYILWGMIALAVLYITSRHIR